MYGARLAYRIPQRTIFTTNSTTISSYNYYFYLDSAPKGGTYIKRQFSSILNCNDNGAVDAGLSKCG